jgi:hypothetical protein
MSVDDADENVNGVNAQRPYFLIFIYLFIYIRARLVLENQGISKGIYKLISIKTQTINQTNIYKINNIPK